MKFHENQFEGHEKLDISTWQFEYKHEYSSLQFLLSSKHSSKKWFKLWYFQLFWKENIFSKKKNQVYNPSSLSQIHRIPLITIICCLILCFEKTI